MVKRTGVKRMGGWVAGATAVVLVLAAGCSGTTTTSTGAPATAAGTTTGSAGGPGSTALAPGTTTKGTSATNGTSPTPDGSVFCTQIRAADDMTKATSGSTQKDKPTQQDIKDFTTALAAARDAGPTEVKDALDTLIAAYDKYATISDDPTKQDQAMEIFFDDKVLAAGTKLEAVVKSECGFELKTGSSSSSATTDGTSPTPDASDADPTSVANVKGGVKAKAGNLSWAPAINDGSWGFSGDGTTTNWVIRAGASNRAFTKDDAFDACTLISDYLQPLEPSFSLAIQTSDGVTLAEKTAVGTGCKKV